MSILLTVVKVTYILVYIPRRDMTEAEKKFKEEFGQDYKEFQTEQFNIYREFEADEEEEEE